MKAENSSSIKHQVCDIYAIKPENPSNEVELNSTSTIPKKSFYSSSPSIQSPKLLSKLSDSNASKENVLTAQLSKDLDACFENLVNQSPRPFYQFKTKRARDEEQNENHLPKSLNSNKSAISSLLTPKRLCVSNKQVRSNKCNQENQENNSDGSIKQWNRNNSLNRSCGKGYLHIFLVLIIIDLITFDLKILLKRFSNLGNTCYMNAILQCLLNIDIFSNELMNNYNLIFNSDLHKYKSTQNECLYK
jgi:hypothetical protein